MHISCMPIRRVMHKLYSMYDEASQFWERKGLLVIMSSMEAGNDPGLCLVKGH